MQWSHIDRSAVLLSVILFVLIVAAGCVQQVMLPSENGFSEHEPSPTGSGSVFVESNVDGARVFVDTEYAGSISDGLLIEGVSAGDRSITVAASGYAPSTVRVSVQEGVREEVKVALMRLNAQSASELLTGRVIDGTVLSNGGFEAESAGWSRTGPASFVDEAVEGELSMRVDRSHPGAFQRVDLVPGQTYTLTASLKTERVNGFGVWVSYVMTSSTDKSARTWSTPIVDGTQDWTEVSYEFTVPDTFERGQVELGIDLGRGSAWFDAISLVPSSPPEPEPAVCGDGVVEGAEECDAGSLNGVACDASYGEVCTYCSDSCTISTVDGGSCGDGVCQDEEDSFTCSADCGPATFCGDGVIQSPNDDGIYEECDWGDSNTDTACTAGYDEWCEYCTASCELVKVDGGSCGDGICQDEETYETCSADCAAPEPTDPMIDLGAAYVEDSGGFGEDNPVEGAWDGVWDGDQSSYPGGSGEDWLWIRFDLGSVHDLSMFRMFPDLEGNWVTDRYYFDYWDGSSWVTIVRNEDVQEERWIEHELDVQARHVRVTAEADESTQFREIELYGTDTGESGESYGSDPDRSDVPHGAFRGDYYNGRSFDTFVASRTDSEIDFDWGYGSPMSGVNDDDFSVRWTGRFDFSEDTYTFNASVDDGIRIYVDGTVVLESWQNQPYTTYTETVPMSAGEHEIMVEYYEAHSVAAVSVSWYRDDEVSDPGDGSDSGSSDTYGARPVPRSATPSSGDTFVSPSGSGTSCTQTSPCTLPTGVSQGGHVWLAPGTYLMSNQIRLRGGTTLESSDPNNKAVIDFQRISTNRLWLDDENVLRNIVVRNSGHSGVYISGSHNLIEGVTSEHNFLSGFQIFPRSGYTDLVNPDGGSYNVFRDSIGRYNNDNCCAVECGASTCSLSHADGFSISAGAHNTIDHSEAYDNSDDGFDLWRSYSSTVSNSVAHGNGYDEGDRSGNGLGFKAGSSQGPDPSRHLIENNWAYGNAGHDFANNGGSGFEFIDIVCGVSQEPCEAVIW